MEVRIQDIPWDYDETALKLALSLLTGFRVNVINAKCLVRDEKHGHIALSGCAMLHHFAFGKPNESSWTKRSVMGHEVAFEDVHPVPARMGVCGIDHPR